MLLGIDIGTTHCKAGLFTPEADLVRMAVRPTVARRAPAGHAYFDPDELWATAAAAIQEVMEPGGEVSAIGVASMAETGLLVERATGQPLTPLFPWFDQSAAPQAEHLRALRPPVEALSRSGLLPSFKCGLAKLLWLREAQGARFAGAMWLSVADFVTLRLTGCAATDGSLAGRTGAFRLTARTWDAAWLRELKLSTDLFPLVLPPGALAGHTLEGQRAATGLPAGVPVAIAGHDHVAAAFAGGAVRPGIVFDSMGTAESLIGALPERPLGEAELASGLLYGLHVMPDTLYWMGSQSAAGGSVEWLRGILNDPAPDYAALDKLVAAIQDAPTGLLYFPYLAGSGAPHADSQVRGALLGLHGAVDRATLTRAVMEGTAYELEYMRRAAELATGQSIQLVRAAGGGTRSRPWMQIKADVSNCRFEAPALADLTLLGAALVGGWAAGCYAGPEAAVAAASRQAYRVIEPRAEHHAPYRRLYERGYVPLQGPLRALAQGLAA